jgi:tetratricopeptide (TPR) repeat protein
MPATILYALLAQAAAAAAGPVTTPAAALPPPTAEARLTSCLAEARGNGDAAIDTADRWLSNAKGAEQAMPKQCLGVIYSRLGEWQMAERMFLDAREAVPAVEAARRARLAAMAGNAALADGRNEDALAALDLAQVDAGKSREPGLLGDVEVDRARALVPLGRLKDADAALANARLDTAQSSDAWLLSAALARREGNLAMAQQYIEKAADLRPIDPEIGLEAGRIAALSGREEAARKSWQSVVDADPASDSAKMAQGYLAELGKP